MKQKECEEHKSEAYIGGGGYTEGEREWFAKVCSFEARTALLYLAVNKSAQALQILRKDSTAVQQLS